MANAGALRRVGRALAVTAVLAVAGAAHARPPAPVLHEPIPPDPAEDLALHVVLDGDLPAAVRTPAGVVSAPDPTRLPRADDAAYRPSPEHDVFVPDRDTSRPQLSAYDDPFTPSTAPFKRLEAYDAVRADDTLYVRDPRQVPLFVGATAGPDDDVFFADLVVELAPNRAVRIPSVGPGARIVRARLGQGAVELPMRVLRDGADVWYLQGLASGAMGAGTRARLVMEIAAPRAAFGGRIGDPSWADLPVVPPLPENVAREAAVVRAAIGVSRRQRPRVALAKLVDYFRGFADSDESPRGGRSVYLDLALSKKGVCRHRAFAFLVTALSLGLPTRMVLNEAHAWVEVNDGSLWKRIDLGGAGTIAPRADDAGSNRVAYVPPPDPFAWPLGARKGDDMVDEWRQRRSFASASGPGTLPAPVASSPAPPGADDSAPVSGAQATMPTEPRVDARAASAVSLDVAGNEVHCGQRLRVRGQVRAAGEPCAYVAVEVWARGGGTAPPWQLGTLATGEDGSFSGALFVPLDAPRGDRELVARTPGGGRCGPGSSE